MAIAVRSRGSATARRQDRAVLIAAGIGLIAAIPFLLPGFPATRDSLSHLFRLWAIDAAVRSGELYPRWLAEFVYGYGYPLLNFYGPLLYYLAEPLRLAGADTLTALRLAIAAGIVAGAVGIYLVARDITGRAGGVIAAAAYVAAPYFQTDLLVRGAFPEAIGMAALPWAIWAVGGAGRRWTVILAVSVAALVLAHNAAALIGLPIVAGYGLWLALLRPVHAREILARTSSGTLIGLALAGFFWLPAVAELNAVWLGNSDGTGEFVSRLAQPADLVDWTPIQSYREVEGAFLAAGAGQVLLALAGLAAAVAFGRRRAGKVLAYPAIVALLATLLMTVWSAPIWQRVPIAPLMAFPWRLQAALAIATALLASGLALLPRPAIAATIAAGVALVAGLAGARPDFLDTAPSAIDAGNFARFDRLSGFIGTTSPVQFRPIGVRADPATLPDPAPPEPITSPLPVVRAEAASDTSYRFTVRATQPTTLRLRVFAFAGWQATVNGAPAPVRAEGPAGILAVAVPSGDSDVVVWFGDTMPRRIGQALSLIGITAIAVLLLSPDRRRPSPFTAAGICGAAAILILAIALPHPVAAGFVPVSADLGAYRLLGYETDLANDRLTVRSLWQVADRATPDGWQAIVRLVDREGRTIAEDIRPPRFGTVSPARWAVGDIVEDAQAIDLPVGIAGGEARLVVGWRSPAGDQIAEAGTLRLPATAASPATGGTAFGNGITLIESQADPVFVSPLGVALPWRGTPQWYDVMLTWRLDAPLREDFRTFVILTDGTRNIAQIDSLPEIDLRYTSAWPIGRPVVQRFRMAVPDLEPGRYRLIAGLYRRQTLERLPAGDSDSVMVREVRIPARQPANAVAKAIGPLMLVGYDRLDRCGRQPIVPCDLSVRLVWRAERTPNDDLTVTIQLIGPDGRLVGQADSPPAGDERTSSWPVGTLVADARTIPLPANRPAGRYRVIAGLYRSGDASASAGEPIDLFDFTSSQ